LNRDYKTE